MSRVTALSNRNLLPFVAAVLVAFCLSGFAQTPPADHPEIGNVGTIFKLGEVIPKVLTLADPQQSYSLFLPSYYSPARRWPIIYAFDPEAQGHVPVELMKDAAEKY